MNPSLHLSITHFLSKASRPGKKVDPEAIQDVQKKLTTPLPSWLVELFTTYPLSGIELEYPVYEPDDEYDGYASIQIVTPDDLYAETEQFFPGLAIRELGYICFAGDPTGGGDPYFIKATDDDNPPVYQVYHDVSDIGTVIEKEGMQKIADSLSDFFEKARPEL
jgi:hypothetical protein